VNRAHRDFSFTPMDLYALNPDYSSRVMIRSTYRSFALLFLAVAFITNASAKPIQLLNVSYDPT
jgi:hypothetical protein